MGTQLTRISRIWRIIAALALVTTMLVVTPAAEAATTVSIANGDVAGLTAAITAANGGTPQIINLATGGDYILTTAYPSNTTYNYSGLPEITGDVTIHGNGATIERSSAAGTPDFGVLDIAPGGSLKIDTVTITGGNNTTGYENGGGIFNRGTLTVTNSTITGNSAPGGGGGIYNIAGGSATVIGSTISNNTSSSTIVNSAGGGIANGNAMTIVNSTITGNFANYGGGGLSATSANTTVINSTITGNTTNHYGDGIGTFGPGGVTVTNSIVANNGTGDLSGTITDGGHNVVNVNPMLGPLTSNGGPTQTMALLPGSPAIDAGNDAVCSASPVGGVDQRGYTRPAGLHCDIGAFELNAVPNQPPTLATNQATVSVSEGQTATDTGTVSEPENETVTLSASIGSVLNNGNGTWSWSFLTNDGPGQSQTVTISGDDGHGGTSQTSFNLVVSNVAPTATFNTPSGSVYSGATFNLSLTNPIDPSTADTTAGFTYAFDCGSGYGSFSSSNSASCTAGGTPSQSVKAQIKDKDGGSTEYTGSVSILTDTTAPVTTASAVTADAAPYTFGTWTNQAVTITLSVSDSGGSGVSNTFYTINGGSQQTYTAPITLSTEGAYTVVYWSTDNASNEETPHQTVSVNIDTTGPAISGAATTSPNANGWYDAPVTIHWTCSDTLSTIATCPSDTTISTEGANQTVSGTAADKAGNGTTVNSSAVNIDLTAPTNVVGAPDRAPDSNGWYNHAVTFTFSGNDATSGIDRCTSTTYNGPDSGTATVTGTCTDLAGNVSAPVNVTIKYDATAPTNVVATPDRAPNDAGWYNAPVTVTFTGDDTTSGIATCDQVTYSGPDSAATTVNGACTDVAGNSTTVTTTIAYDATAPVIVYTGSAGNYSIGQIVSISCAASDNLSGVVTTDCQDINAAAYTFTAGSNTISSTATDAAGNVGQASVTFTVTATADDLTTLTNQFIDNSTVAHRLSAPLGGITLANRLQNPRMKQAFLNTYIMLVNQQRGSTLTDQQADTLIALAKTL